MAETRTVTKALGGVEDLAYGKGTVRQARAGGVYDITKNRVIRPVDSIAEMNELDPEQFPEVYLTATKTIYEYSGNSYTAVTAVPTFDTVAAMKTFNYFQYFPEGSEVNVRGYYEKDDGGGFKGVLEFGPNSDDGGSVHSIDNNTYVSVKQQSEVLLKQWGVLFDDDTDNTVQLQRVINYCANNKINCIKGSSGVARYTRLWFVYDSVNNPDFPSTVRSGWGLKVKGQGRLYTEDVSEIETEISSSLGTILRSTESTAIPINMEVQNTSTIQAGVQFEDIAFVANNTDFILKGSATPQSRLFSNVSFHQKHVNGSGVIVEDLWISTWGDVLIAGQDTTGTQTGTGIILRNRLFAGGGMWNFGNINIRGFKNSGNLGYMTDPGFEIKLLDSIVAGVVQSRNSENGLKIGGKVRSIVLLGYHTEACTVTGGQIAAEASSVLILGSYWDCALCSNASLVLGNASGTNSTNLDERSWSEVELRSFNFIDTHKVAIKIADGTIGENLVLASGKIGRVSGDGDLGIDFNNFQGNIKLSNVRYVDLTSEVANRPNAISYTDNGNFECNRDAFIQYQKKSVNVEALTSTKFLSIEDPENQFITPDVTNSRIVLPVASSNRSFKIKNLDATYNLNVRNTANTATLYTVNPTESVEVISDGSSWYFI